MNTFVNRRFTVTISKSLVAFVRNSHIKFPGYGVSYSIHTKRFFCDKKTPVVTKFGSDDNNNNNNNNSNSNSNNNQSNNKKYDYQRPKRVSTARRFGYFGYFRRVFIIASLSMFASAYVTYLWAKHKLGKLEQRHQKLWREKEGLNAIYDVVDQYIINQSNFQVKNEIDRLLNNSNDELFTDSNSINIKIDVQGGYQVNCPIYQKKHENDNDNDNENLQKNSNQTIGKRRQKNANRRKIGDLHINMAIRDPFTLSYFNAKEANAQIDAQSIFSGFDFLKIELHPTKINNNENIRNINNNNSNNYSNKMNISRQPIVLYVNDKLQKQAKEFIAKSPFAERATGIVNKQSLSYNNKNNSLNPGINMSLFALRDRIIRQYGLPFNINTYNSFRDATPIVFYEKIENYFENIPENSGKNKNFVYRLLIEFPLIDKNGNDKNKNDNNNNNISWKVLIFDMIKLDVTENGLNGNSNVNDNRGCLVVGIKDKSANNFQSSIDDELFRYENWEIQEMSHDDAIDNIQAKQVYDQVYSLQFERTG